MSEEAIEEDVSNLLDVFYNKVEGKELNNTTIEELKKLKLSALELLKNHIVFNTSDNFARDILVKIVAEDLYYTREELLFTVINEIEKNEEIRKFVNYLLSYASEINLSENADNLDFYFRVNVKINGKYVLIHLGTVRFDKESKNINAWLGYEDNEIFKISTSEKVYNTYNRQLKGFISWLNEQIKKMQDIFCDP